MAVSLSESEGSMRQACDIKRLPKVWGKKMGRDVAPGRSTSARRSTEDYFTAFNALEDALYQPLDEVLQLDVTTIAPKPIFEIIGTALAPIKHFFHAQIVQCWVEGRDGTLHAVGEPACVENVLQYLRLTVEAALAGDRAISRTNQRVGTLIVMPMHMGKQMRGALTIARTNGQAFDAAEKAAIKTIAHRLTHAIGTGLAWRNANDQAHYWQTIINSIPEIIIIRDTKQRVIFYNEGALEAAANAHEIRNARKQALPEPMPRWDTTLPNNEPLPPDQVPSMRAMSGNTKVLGAQLELTIYPENAEPQMIPVLTTAVPLHNSAGELVRSVTIAQDMSSTKQVERMKDFYTERVRHDVNGPLTSTKIAAELIERKCNESIAMQATLTAEQLASFIEYVQVIKQGCVAISGLTSSLNEIGQVISSAPVRLSLVDFVYERLQDFRVRYPQHHFPCDVCSVDTLLEGYWCKDHLGIIFNNLVENAIKYAPGTDTISIKLMADTYAGKSMAHMVITDQGIGIHKKDAALIFQKDMRANPVDQEGRPIAGTGIGLYLCEVCTRLYDGKIWVKSEGKGTGSEFHVRLPLAQ